MWRDETNDELSFKDLALIECVMLLALSTGQRAQTLKALDLNSLFDDIDENKITFTFEQDTQNLLTWFLSGCRNLCVY